jgi:hypothetical protein
MMMWLAVDVQAQRVCDSRDTGCLKLVARENEILNAKRDDNEQIKVRTKTRGQRGGLTGTGLHPMPG